MNPLELKKSIEEQRKTATGYKRSSEDKAAYEYVEKRKDFLQQFRKSKGIEDIWRAADNAYIPHKIEAKKGRKVFVSDDELGWRSSLVDLQTDDNWQEDSVSVNPYIKIQTALGIIVDRNPRAVLSPGAKKYEKNKDLMKALYERSWDIAKSKDILLKPLVFNAAKYGKGVGRTYPLNITNTVEDLTEFNAENPNKSRYENSSFTFYDDVFRESLNPWEVWFDESAQVLNPWSCNDAIYFKDYNWEKFMKRFGHLKNFKYVVPTERVLDKESALVDYDKGTHEGNMASMKQRVWFYENFDLDMLFIYTENAGQDIVLVNEPLPKRPRNKRLSVWSVPWTLRNDKDLDGIGVYEAMRNDHKIQNKIRNMTVDQLVQSIYREFFFSGTDTLEGDGIMRTRPGRGRQVTDPKNIRWNEVPGPGAEAWEGMRYFGERIDDASGISKSLEGQITGSTAFEISQARESALKRMKTPLENITAGLEVDAYLSLGIFEDMYSVPKIRLTVDDKYVDQASLSEYKRDDGTPYVEGEDYNAEPREFPINVEKGQDGAFVKSEEVQYVSPEPEELHWEGIIQVEGQSIIANSELLERVTKVELGNLVVPLFQLPPDIAMKPASQILKAYNEDPDDWFPEAWLNPPAPAPAQGKPMFVSPEEMEAQKEAPPEQTGMKTVNGKPSTLAPDSGAGSIASDIKQMLG